MLDLSCCAREERTEPRHLASPYPGHSRSHAMVRSAGAASGPSGRTERVVLVIYVEAFAHADRVATANGTAP